MATVELTPESVTTTLFPQATQEVSLSWSVDLVSNTHTLLSQVLYYGLDDEADNTNYTQLVANTDTSVTLTLPSGAEYRFWVVIVTSYDGAITSTTSDVQTIDTIVLVPNAPVLISAARGNELVTLTWSQDTTYGTASSFSLVYTPDGGSTAVTTVLVDDIHLSGTGTSIDPYTYTLTPLNVNEYYEVSMLALNAGGSSSSSNFLRFETSGVPTVPLNFSATGAYNVSIPVSFESPANYYEHDITSYVVRVIDDKDNETLVNIPKGNLGVNGDQYTYTLTNADLNDTSSIVGTAGVPSFVNGTEYTISVYAVNSEGNGDETSTDTPTPSAVPDKVVFTAPSHQDINSIVYTITEPANNGSAITQYTLIIRDSSGNSLNGLTVTDISGELTVQNILTDFYAYTYTLDPTNLTGTITGTTLGSTYSVNIVAYNASYGGSINSKIDVIPSTVPSINTALVATSWQNEQSSLTWAFNNNGSDINTQTLTITYLDSNNSNALTYVTLSEGALVSTGTTAVHNSIDKLDTSFIVGGLTNGINYTFAVNAENYSGISNDLTDTAVPGTDTDLTFNASSYYNEYIPMTFSVNAIPSAELSEYTLTVTNVKGLTVNDLTVTDGSATKTETVDSTVYTITNGATGATLSGLTNGGDGADSNGANGTPYSLTLVAVPNNGTNLTQTLTNLIPATAPNAPTSLTVTNAFNVSSYAGELDVTWAAPTSNGGAAVNGYIMQWATSSDFLTGFGSAGVSGFTHTLTELTEGTLYYVRILATNAATDAPALQTAKVSSSVTNTVYGQVELTNVAHFSGNTLQCTLDLNGMTTTQTRDIVYAQITPTINDQVIEKEITGSSETFATTDIVNLNALVIITTGIFDPIIFNVTESGGYFTITKISNDFS